MQAARDRRGYLGVPDGEFDRVAVLTDAPPAPADYDARWSASRQDRSRGAFNRRELVQASIPGSGACSVRAGSLVTMRCPRIGASSMANACFPRRHRGRIELQSFEWDEIYRIRERRALGYRRGIDTGPLASPEAFGHVGGGGSFGYADPARRLGIGFGRTTSRTGAGAR